MADKDRGKKGHFDRHIPGFDEEFHKRLHERIANMVNEAIKCCGDPAMHDPETHVSGFTMHAGPDGNTKFEEFGNIGHESDIIAGQREPLVDIIEVPDGMNVLVELPGVDKKDIDLAVGEKSLSIRVNTDTRKYSKDLILPRKIDPKKIKAKYKNGILEVKLKSNDADIDSKRKVDIE